MPDVKKVVEFLAKVPLFQDLNERQLERLAGRLVRRAYTAGQDMVTQGKGGAGLFIITSGAAEAIRVRSDGSKAVVNTFGPTDFFGEMALLDEEPRTASVVATEDTECLVLSQWELMGEMRQDADVAVGILQEVVRRFRRALNVM
ncbi:MAG: cyclic nucleotide-binding domain-containing protein [Anaerolineae bacterium]|nr:cyclic nucleotide-binding domain-containing protein [Anaerolineae bacterium]